MHVDGGAVARTFLYPPQIGILVNLQEGPLARQRHAYIIRSGRLDPEWASVDRRLMSISGRAIATMIHYSGYNDVLRIYSTTQRDGVDYNLAYIGRDFTVEHKEDFDPVYMKRYSTTLIKRRSAAIRGLRRPQSWNRRKGGG